MCSVFCYKLYSITFARIEFFFMSKKCVEICLYRCTRNLYCTKTKKIRETCSKLLAGHSFANESIFARLIAGNKSSWSQKIFLRDNCYDSVFLSPCLMGYFPSCMCAVLCTARYTTDGSASNAASTEYVTKNI